LGELEVVGGQSRREKRREKRTERREREESTSTIL